MQVDLGIWGWLTRAVLVLLAAAGVVTVALWYAPLIQQDERMRKEILRLDALIQQEEANSKRLKAAIDALAHDPKTIERTVRRDLGYAKPGETVIRFEPPPSNHLVSP